MKNNVKISVIIPMYNIEKYLRECLESVIRQSLRDIEIICVNDGSHDGYRTILDGYMQKDKRIILLDYQENNGQAYARNRGIEKASGEYICFLDADDLLQDGSLERLYSTAKKENVEGILFSAESFSEDGCESYVYPIERKRSSGINCSGREMMGLLHSNGEYSSAVWSQFWRRAYLIEKSVYFSEDLKQYEDILFTVRALWGAKQICCIPDVLYLYRRRKKSTTTMQISEKKAMYIFAAYVESMNFFEKEVDKLSSAETRMIGLFAKRYSNFVRDTFRQLTNQGKNIRDVSFVSKEYEYIFYTKIMDHFAMIPDFMPVELLKKIKAAKKVIVYGAGNVGKEVIQQLYEYGVVNFLVAVTNKKENTDKVMGNDIHEIRELKAYSKDSIVLVSAVKRHQEEMVLYLQENGFKNYVCMM